MVRVCRPSNKGVLLSIGEWDEADWCAKDLLGLGVGWRLAWFCVAGGGLLELLVDGGGFGKQALNISL